MPPRYCSLCSLHDLFSLHFFSPNFVWCLYFGITHLSTVRIVWIVVAKDLFSRVKIVRLHPKHHRVLTNVMHAAWRSMAFVFVLLRVNWWVFRIFVAVYSFWYFPKFIPPFRRFVVCFSFAISSRVSYSLRRSSANEIRFLNVRRAPFLSIYCRLSYLIASLINTDECVHIKVSLHSLSENYSSRKKDTFTYCLNLPTSSHCELMVQRKKIQWQK